MQNEDSLSPWLPASPSRSLAHVAPAVTGMATECWRVEYRIGTRSLPYLSDHGFHDLVVLPGSFYIALIRQIHRELFQRDAVSLHHIEFEKPVILNEDDVALTIRVERRGDGRIAYEVFEATDDVLQNAPTQQVCARLLVDIDAPPEDTNYKESTFFPGEFCAAANNLGTGADFYRQLRNNGNQYGPAFQTLGELWRSGTHVAGSFGGRTSNGGDSLSPPLLDAASQLLSAFTLERGRTFILKSIEHLVIDPATKSKPHWVHATKADSREPAADALTGSIEALDENGARLWELLGVKLAFIDRPASTESPSPDATPLCVASTFTAEPLEDSLRFWSAHFGRAIRAEFAPYNQVFQQLLDPVSAFRQNRDGINLIVLALEDWQKDDKPALHAADSALAASCFGTRPRYVLPNGLEIVHLNRYETDYVYQEIFGDQSYLRHDIQLADGDTVIDIGANIGLFSLFVMSRCKNPAIYACEPSPRVFDLLRANCAAYGDPSRVHVFNCGVSGKKGTGTFTFYQHSSVFSSFHPDAGEDRAAVQAVVRNVLEQELPGAVHEADVQDLTTARLHSETIECPLTTVSDLIRENGIERIHLLKIDAEKSELAILRGIDEEHWPLIEQLVIEVHDRSRAAVESIDQQLTRRGFRCAVVEEKLLEQSGLFNIYATRRAPISATADGLHRKVGEFCAALDTFITASPMPLVLAIAPPSPGSTDSALVLAEEKLLARAARHPQVRCIASKEILARYPTSEFHDPHSHQLGHMPFTQEGYAAIGTAVSRAIFNISAPPIKVIVLDCDNTLWQGLCAEDGPTGVVVTPAFRRLQEAMLAQMKAGILLALCSKNQEADVVAVFEQHTEMMLHREHLAGWRINWESKPDNLRSLAAQFNLGLDSFVFLDDNPVECAAVRAGCPEVIVLQIPQQQERIPAFLDSLWIFDRATATQEDLKRSQWYQADSERTELRSAAPTLRDFLDGLQLRIDVSEATDDQLARVAQLTMRTNQFNLTSVRRSEGEIRDLLKSGARCLATTVSDRFGDYGLVGTILYTANADRFSVDTLLLSCRALGKGVEHRMLAELASRALREEKSIIALPCRRSERNQPAVDFIARLAAVPAAADFVIEVPAVALAELRYAPDENAVENTSDTSVAAKRGAMRGTGGSDRTKLSAAMQALGDGLTTIDSIVAAMESSRLRNQPSPDLDKPEGMEGASTFERSLATIWKKALGRSNIGINENFFDVGGTSLKAVVVVAMIRKELKLNVSIITLFECPTIKALAVKLGVPMSAGDNAAATGDADSRGRQRRNKLIKRKVA